MYDLSLSEDLDNNNPIYIYNTKCIAEPKSNFKTCISIQFMNTQSREFIARLISLLINKQLPTRPLTGLSDSQNNLVRAANESGLMDYHLVLVPKLT